MKSILFIFCMIFILSSTSNVFGHEVGAPFSGAISEPVILHHAHIEDEQSLNMSFRDDFQKEEGGEKRSAFGSALEFASSWGDDYNFGSEIFIPTTVRGKLFEVEWVLFRFSRSERGLRLVCRSKLSDPSVFLV